MKRLLTLVFALCLLLAGRVSAVADETGHTCSGLRFDTPLHGDLRDRLEEGSYYLDGDCRVMNHVQITGVVDLCLNGFKADTNGANTFEILEGGVLNLYDCQGTGVIGAVLPSPNNNHPITITGPGTLNMYGGTLYVKRGSNAINSDGTVNMFGGRIQVDATGFCAIRNDSGTVNLYGGEFTADVGVSARFGHAALYLCEPGFIMNCRLAAFQYVEEEQNSMDLQMEHYLWRLSPDGEFIDSDEQPYVYNRRHAYVEFQPAGDRPLTERAPE